MKYRILLTALAVADIRAAVTWWRDHRSSAEAERWYSQIYPAIETLSGFPDRCPLAPEEGLLPSALRQLHFGVSRKATHRIVFTIDGKDVVILRVRHIARRNLTPEDLR